MTMRDRRILGLVAAGMLAVLALGAALLWISGAPSVSGGSIRAAPSESSVARPKSARLAAVATDAPRAELDDELAPAEDATGASPASASIKVVFPQPRVLLRGRVEGCAGDVWATELRVTVSSGKIRRALVLGSPDARGEFELDVSALFMDGMTDTEADALLLEASHPANLPGRTTILAEIDGRPLDRTSLHARALSRLHGNVSLLPAAWIVGTARTEDGTREGLHVTVLSTGSGVASQALADGEGEVFFGHRGRDGADVSALVNENGPPSESVGDGWTDRDGRFRIRVEPGTSLIAFACAPGFVPATLRAAVTGPGDLEVGELLLTHGVSISGCVQLGSSLVASGGAVCALRVSSSPPLSASGCGSYQWTGETLGTISDSAIADTEGCFRISGLTPGEYELRLLAAPGAQVRMSQGPRVLAPASQIDLGASVSVVHLEFTDRPVAGRPIEFMLAELGQNERGLGNYATDAHGRITFWLQATTTYVISQGGERKFQFTSPRGGGEQSLSVGP